MTTAMHMHQDDPEPPPRDADAARERLLADVDRWLAVVADKIDVQVELLTRVESVFPAARQAVRRGGADELSVRRGERAFVEGVEGLASLAVDLRRGAALRLAPQRVGGPLPLPGASAPGARPHVVRRVMTGLARRVRRRVRR
ncbi:MAG: hypothetical protein JHC95_11205 [Solirubrobacteraceae bacterium]|nr:hypothetical protein [Solirubrobacteraceae bacterium]